MRIKPALSSITNLWHWLTSTAAAVKTTVTDSPLDSKTALKWIGGVLWMFSRARVSILDKSPIHSPSDSGRAIAATTILLFPQSQAQLFGKFKVEVSQNRFSRTPFQRAEIHLSA
jgi:hypothetical protein